MSQGLIDVVSSQEHTVAPEVLASACDEEEDEDDKVSTSGDVELPQHAKLCFTV